MLIRLPGIGPRQAARLIYRLLDERDDFRESISSGILGLKELKKCVRCYKTHEDKNTMCKICRSETRNSKVYMIVEKDMDLDTIEKTGVHEGFYFVLGGALSPLMPESYKHIRLKNFSDFLEKDNNVEEVILATSATTEGDHTAQFIEKILSPIINKKTSLGKPFNITRLGRGLSTGLELEYSDRETFKSAYLNRR